MIAATARPVGVAVSIPSPDGSQEDAAVAEIGDRTSYLGDRSAEAVDSGHDDGIAGAGVVEQGRKAGAVGASAAGKGVGEDPGGVDACGRQCGVLGGEVLAGGADAGVAQDCGHTGTVSLPTDSGDSRHAV